MPHAQVQERASLRYRADIDGLRALAVVPVVFYHFRVARFGGGFVGVDIFFVISGYLITGLIYAEMRTGEYSLAGFYERRIRRILPALFAILIATVVAALWLLFPDDLSHFGESMAATAVFGSNFDFWQQSGYFDSAAETKPLLHTWSLAVEEQFYLVFPLLLGIFRSQPRRVLLLLTGGLALSSFAFGLWAVRAYPTMAFYLAPARIWELMLGSFLSLGDYPRAHRWLAEVLSLVGAALLGIGVFGFAPGTAMPGANALVPCGGAALLIYANAGQETAIARALSWRPVVFVGLISYSLYLWHWPVFVFARYGGFAPLPLPESAALIAVSVALAVLSWRFVEQPFRDRRRFTRNAVFAFAGAGIAISVAVGLALVAAAGLPQRFPLAVQRILAATKDRDPRDRTCGGGALDDIRAGRVCILGDPRAKPSFALWGDSHAASLIPVVSAVAADAHRAGYFLGHSGCAPMLDVMTSEQPSLRCARINAAALSLVRQRGIGEVLVVGRWAYYDRGHGTAADPRDARRLIDLDSNRPDEDQHAVFARVLERTVSQLTAGGRRVILIADVPEIDSNVPMSLARMMLNGTSFDLGPTLSAYRARQAFVERDFTDLARRYGVAIAEPALVLCAGGHCAVTADGQPLYRDHHHLSTFGALYLRPLFAKIL
jgi:peptidoglycan/LPS O-acetylase OafA/YrhL